MLTIRKAAGLSALAEAAIYCGIFVFFGVYWDYPTQGNTAQKIAFLAEHKTVFMLTYLIGYILFGVLLAVLVTGLHRALKSQQESLSQVASVFGVAWVVMVLASGMIANIGLGQMLKLSATQPDQAWTLWIAVTTIVEGLGGGNEVVGGIWVLLVSIAAWRAHLFPSWINAFGIVVGALGISTMVPTSTLTELFGVTQILWFVLIGWRLLR